MSDMRHVIRICEAVASIQFDPADGEVQEVRVRFPWTPGNGQTIWVTAVADATDLIDNGVDDELRLHLIEDGHTDPVPDESRT